MPVKVELKVGGHVAPGAGLRKPPETSPEVPETAEACEACEAPKPHAA